MNCFNQYIKFALCLMIITVLTFSIGCADKPELQWSDYGKVVDTLPDLPNRPQKFLLPEGVDEPDCHVERQILRDKEILAKEKAEKKMEGNKKTSSESK